MEVWLWVQLSIATHRVMSMTLRAGLQSKLKSHAENVAQRVFPIGYKSRECLSIGFISNGCSVLSGYNSTAQSCDVVGVEIIR